MKIQDAVNALGALAHESRLTLFRLLVRCGPSGMPAGEIAKAIGIGPTALSFHLKELDRAGLLRSWREGRFIRYAVHVAGIRSLLTYLTEDCCAGQPELCGAGWKPTEDFCAGEVDDDQ
jgi:DNA-binding transcriptional ArsR family regulator